ncbi:hypothetical protein [uncultured Microbacterium sp.]|uniref:hypothetical protein n=1 Tax=uncultured Microbacterium sp. TaxID=191216 RepID=UPI0025CBAA1C|nr:hypothetical protein [uncultured Microbacterium sp.]
MKMPFEWDVRVSSKGLHGDRAHVYDETGHRELHHVKGHYYGIEEVGLAEKRCDTGGDRVVGREERTGDRFGLGRECEG